MRPTLIMLQKLGEMKRKLALFSKIGIKTPKICNSIMAFQKVLSYFIFQSKKQPKMLLERFRE